MHLYDITASTLRLHYSFKVGDFQNPNPIRSHVFLSFPNRESEEFIKETEAKFWMLCWHGEHYCDWLGEVLNAQNIEEAIHNFEYRYRTRITEFTCYKPWHHDEVYWLSVTELENIPVNPRNLDSVGMWACFQVDDYARQGDNEVDCKYFIEDDNTISFFIEDNWFGTVEYKKDELGLYDTNQIEKICAAYDKHIKNNKYTGVCAKLVSKKEFNKL